MRLRSRAGRLVAIALGVVGLTIGLGTTPAFATQTQICGNGGTGYCLNDWNGNDTAGAPIKMYNGGNSNENFWVHHLTGTCGGAGYVTVSQSCWGQWGTNGNLVIGEDIVSIAYGPGGCLGSDAGGGAVIQNCPNDNGTGGGFGTVFALFVCGPFGQPQEDCLSSRPWSSTDGTIADLQSGGNPGVQATMRCHGGCTVWGGPGAPEQ